MFELTIKGNVYQFNFGMGFMREVNKLVQKPVEGLNNIKENVGLQYMVSGVKGGDIEILVDVLDAANKGQAPRVTKALLDEYIDDASTDIDALFEEVLENLKSSNATKKAALAILAALAKAEANA